MKLSKYISSISAILSSQWIISSYAFRTSTQTTPLKTLSIDKTEINQRLGISSPVPPGLNSRYNLQNEHEVLCPITNSHQGIFSTTSSTVECFTAAESIADNNELLSQVIFSGSLAASIRNRDKHADSLYFLPFVITLVESNLADEISFMLMDEILARNSCTEVEYKEHSVTSSLVQNMIFNSGGLETNEILLDLNGINENLILYACNTQMDEMSASSDVYLIPPAAERNNGVDKVWRFTIDYKLVTVNLSQIRSFGTGKSTMRPDVWLKDDYF